MGQMKQPAGWGVAAALVVILVGCLGGASGARFSPPSVELPSPSGTWNSPTISDHLAGYVIGTGIGGVFDVRGEWRVPQIAATCPSTPTFSSFYVGMDGYRIPFHTWEAVGSSTNCVGGAPVYYAWYQLYPIKYAKMPLAVSPADQLAGDVSYHSGAFSFSLKDLTTGKSFHTSINFTRAYRDSAEWVAQDPSPGGILASLTDFGWVTFTNANATVRTPTGNVVTTPGNHPHTAVAMWNIRQTKVMASVGPLSSNGSVFRVTWKSRGP
ncbi:MAG TPA: G1 family glutamic endopeptidase [Thermoplasmata archaeon]|nr:G1 family glutamic endopeptidase [Thermoplasmata archaeon]